MPDCFTRKKSSGVRGFWFNQPAGILAKDRSGESDISRGAGGGRGGRG